MAKKKSKEELAKEADALKAIFAAAKKKEQNCALVVCADGFAIEADPRLSTDNLWKKARKAPGATPKGVKARLNVQGSEVFFSLEEEPPGGIDTKFKQYLTMLGVKAKLSFLAPGEEAPITGAPAAAGDAERESDDAGAQEDAVGDDQSRKKKLTKAFGLLKPELQRTLKIGNAEHKSEMEDLLKSFGDQMKADDIQSSEKTIRAFKDRIEAFDRKRGEGVAERKPRLEDVGKRAAALKARLEELIASRGAA